MRPTLELRTLLPTSSNVGADVEAQDNDGATPLDLALDAGNRATAQVLEEHAEGTSSPPAMRRVQVLLDHYPSPDTSRP